MDTAVPPGQGQPQPATTPPPPVYGQRQPTPPPLSAQPPAPRKSWTAWRWVIIAVALLFVAYSVLSGVRNGLRAALSQGDGIPTHGLEESIIENNHSSDKILVLDISGMISSEMWDRSGRTMVNNVRDKLDMARKDPAVKAVILKVDSPGGEVLASDEIYKYLTNFQKKSGKPVIASMGTLAASGGYYVSAPCQWIVANELTITGSIGVIMHGYNYRGLMDKVGVRPEVFKSGKFKDMLSPDKKESDILPEERQMIQSMIEETFGRFKRIVAEGRAWALARNKDNADKGRELSADWVSLADGRVLTGNQAFDKGFVDELGNFRTAYERALKIAKLPTANLVHFEQPFDLSSVFRLLGKTEAPAIKVDLGLDLPRIRSGYMYFLYSQAAR